MKKIFLLSFLLTCGSPLGISLANTFDPATNILTMDAVILENQKFSNVVVRIDQLTVSSIGSSSPDENRISETCETENLTTDKFDVIQIGMSLDQITQIMGCKFDRQIFHSPSYQTTWENINNAHQKIVVFSDPEFGADTTPTALKVAGDEKIGHVSKLSFNLSSASSLTGSASTFDPASKLLTLDSVSVTGDLKYKNVEIYIDQFTVLGVGGSTVVHIDTPTPVNPVPDTPPPVNNGVSGTCSSSNFTRDKFNAIQVGMSLDQVTQIIGCEFSDVTGDSRGELRVWRDLSGVPAKTIYVAFEQPSLTVTGLLGNGFKGSTGF